MNRGHYLAAAVLMICASGCVEQEPERPSADDLRQIKQHILKQAPKNLKFQVNADLEGNVVYLGADLDQPVVRPGVQFTVTHYWQVKKAVPGWKVFTHLSDPNQKRFINADHKPVGGRYAASFWKPGEIVRDVHPITLPADWSEPQVRVFTGLWKGKLRMKPTGPQDKDNRVIAATIPVKVAGVARPKVKQLIATRTDKPVKIDGKLDDPIWSKAKSTGLFVDTMRGTAARIQTEAKVAWDDKYLYVAFDNKDDDIWSEFKKRDDKLYTQEAVEVFIDANGDGKEYVELQVNPHGVIFDSYLPTYRKNDNSWNSKLLAKVNVDGTVDKRGDKDKAWTVEMAIPWQDALGKSTVKVKTPPALGDTWRVNFFRMDKPAKGPQVAAGWSPPMVGDFHKLDRFGEIVFGDAEGKVPPNKMSAAPGAPGLRATAMAPAQPVGKVVRMAQPLRRSVVEMRAKRAPLPRPAGAVPAQSK